MAVVKEGRGVSRCERRGCRGSRGEMEADDWLRPPMMGKIPKGQEGFFHVTTATLMTNVSCGNFFCLSRTEGVCRPDAKLST